ncbi:hypothetical protein Q361_103103 [Flavobacterium croceum DSM 17960]|uniref:Tetratricopeptide repeat protein n=1 Tax=Flavobacterium croceum DSM 17960 TaxID=1121886 RepID=A0A2S4NAW2_9FLAO|nr:hypothetical protein [Flavobacterium croceum]POS02593.1 hypothetical protein Q361_103103 [Flavobacterium croceum DSM 17960]
MNFKICLALTLFSSFIFAQEKKIKNGDYILQETNGPRINLKIEDNQFSLTYILGTYEIKNDSLYFKTENDGRPTFLLDFSGDNSKSKTISIKLDSNRFRYNTFNKYIGFQETPTSEIKYQTFAEAFHIEDEDYRETNPIYSAEFDKAAFIYFVEESYKESIVEKYAIPQNTTNISVGYSTSFMKSIKLKGYYDEKENSVVITEGRKPIKFIEKTNLPETKNSILPIEVTNPKVFSYVGKKSNPYDDYGVEVDTVAVSEIDGDYKPPYTFKHTKIGSYKEGIQTLEKGSKYLVVVLDNSKDAKDSFDEFIKDSEQSISNQMYDGYDAEMDKFNFYLANTKQDKALYDKYAKKGVEILFFNKNNTLLYHTNGNLNANDELFSTWSSFYDGLQQLDKKEQLDKILSNKKVSLEETKKALASLDAAHNTPENVVEDYAVPPPIPVKTISVEDKSGDQEQRENIDRAAIAAAVAVDSAAAEVYSNNYDFRDKENIYKLKAEKSLVASKWNQIANQYLSTGNYDKDFAILALRELEYGVVENLYDENKSYQTSDKKYVEYLLKHSTSILNEDPNDLKYNTMLNSLNQYFQRNLYAQTVSETDKNAILNDYKNFIKLSGNTYQSVSDLLYFLEDKDRAQYFEVYEEFYNSIVNNKQSIIENLDQKFSIEGTHQSWDYYKESVGSLSNNVAWKVVEDRNQSYYSKALSWSELSLKLEPKSHYSIDTYANLLYLNGQKQKAIETEQKAIDLAKKIDKTYSTKEYESVLEKMKNGTY